MKTLLNSLTEDDYFSVIKFSAAPEVVGCWGESLVPATTPYKRAMFEAIDNMTAHGQADLGRAVEFACEFMRQFQNSRQSDEGALCHKTVMLFTDGGVDWPQRAAVKCNQVRENVDHGSFCSIRDCCILGLSIYQKPFLQKALTFYISKSFLTIPWTTLCASRV
jgi:hypothetical protein